MRVCEGLSHFSIPYLPAWRSSLGSKATLQTCSISELSQCTTRTSEGRARQSRPAAMHARRSQFSAESCGSTCMESPMFSGRGTGYCSMISPSVLRR